MGYKKITLGGNQVCDYLHIKKTPINQNDFKYINVEPDSWDNDTLMLAKFSKGDMSAGNSSLIQELAGYEIRRRTGANLYTEYIGKIPEQPQGGKPNKFLIDYGVKNNNDYTYYLYPSATHSGNGIILYPSITSEVRTDWGYWSLLVVDESKEDNVFYLNKMFKFELNVTTEPRSNNAVVSVLQNFTRFPTVQYGTANYWSGGLSALCGFVSCNDYKYIQTPNMIDELKDLTSDTRRKFLKDIDGNIWEVKITSPISISTNDNLLERVKTVKISWAEVADASKVSIINNPNQPVYSWVLTDSGEAAPYTEYIWDEKYHWDNSRRWTAREDLLENKSSNLGRDIYYKEGGGNSD